MYDAGVPILPPILLLAAALAAPAEPAAPPSVDPPAVASRFAYPLSIAGEGRRAYLLGYQGEEIETFDALRLIHRPDLATRFRDDARLRLGFAVPMWIAGGVLLIQCARPINEIAPEALLGAGFTLLGGGFVVRFGGRKLHLGSWASDEEIEAAVEAHNAPLQPPAAPVASRQREPWTALLDPAGGIPDPSTWVLDPDDELPHLAGETPEPTDEIPDLAIEAPDPAAAVPPEPSAPTEPSVPWTGRYSRLRVDELGRVREADGDVLSPMQLAENFGDGDLADRMRHVRRVDTLTWVPVTLVGGTLTIGSALVALYGIGDIVVYGDDRTFLGGTAAAAVGGVGLTIGLVGMITAHGLHGQADYWYDDTTLRRNVEGWNVAHGTGTAVHVTPVIGPGTVGVQGEF